MFCTARTKLGSNHVFVHISLDELTNRAIASFIYALNEITNAVTVHVITQFDLRFNFVTFGDCHIPHVIAKAGDFHPLPI